MTQFSRLIPTTADLLDDLARLADDLAVDSPEALSPRTRAAYESDWRQWETWCLLHEVSALPVDPALVRLYVADMASQARPDDARRFKAATIERHLASLAWHSRLHGGIHDLSRHPQVLPVLRGIRSARTQRPRRARPLRRDDVALLVASMTHHTWPAGVISARDSLTVLLAFTAALHRSQVAALSVGDAALLDLPRTENPVMCASCSRARWMPLLAAPDRAARMRHVLATGPSQAWQHICDDPAPGEGLDAAAPLLRAVSKTGQIGDRALSDSALAQMLKRRLQAAGFDSPRYEFGSLRSGATSHL